MSRFKRFLQQSWQKLTPILHRHRLSVLAVGYFLVVSALDVLTTIYMPINFVEQNPWSRDTLHRFILSRGVMIKVFSLVSLFGVAWPMGLLGRVLGEREGDAAFALPFFAFGMSTLIAAVFPNFLNALGWYMP